MSATFVSGLRDHHVPEDYVRSVIDTAIRTNRQAEDHWAAEWQAALFENLRHANLPRAHMARSQTRRGRSR